MPDTTEHNIATVKTYTVGLFNLKTHDALDLPLPTGARTKNHAIGLLDLKTFDALSTPTPTTPATDDLGLVDGSFGSSAATVRTSDGKATTITQKTRFQWVVPKDYEAAAPLTLRVKCAMKTTVSDGTATIDASAYTVDEPSTDIIATAAQSINSLTPANIDFALTETNLVAGDVIDIMLTIAITDASTGTAVIGSFDRIQMIVTEAAATDDLRLTGGSFGSSAASLRTSDADSTTVTQRARFQYQLPAEYVAGEAITLRLNCGMITTVSDTSAVVDVEIYTFDEPGTDINSTGATSINSLTAADKDFALTETNLAPGDVLDIRLTIAITDGSTGAPVIGVINKVQLLITTKDT